MKHILNKILTTTRTKNNRRPKRIKENKRHVTCNLDNCFPCIVYSKKKNKKLEEFVGLSYLIPKFKLDINKMDLNYVFFMVSLIDAFIISFVFVVITIIPWDMGFSMLLGFVLLFGLIYALYEILGRVLVKKGWSKNES